MPDILSTGVSGLLAFQRALDTTSHNIANANTPGYNRQVVDFATREADRVGSNWVGTGVDAASIRRVYDQAISTQARSANSTLQQLDTFSNYADRLDQLFSSSSTGLAPSLQQFNNAIETLATTPSDGTARQLVLSQAQSLVSRLKGFQSTIDSLSGQLGSQLGAESGVVNSLARSIATLNGQIVAAHGQGLHAPNDLLDKRDALVSELATHVAVTTVTEDSGAMTVSIGSGQVLVSNNTANTLSVSAASSDRSELRLILSGQAAPVDVSDYLSGGTIGGLMQLQTGLLTPAQNSLGQVALGIATLANQQQQAGLDLRGNFGSPMFSIAPVTVSPASSNTGTAAVAVTRTSLANGTANDYDLRYTGSAWQLLRHDNGTVVTMSGSGTALSPFVADGLSMVVSGTPQAGDSILVQPTHDVVGGLNLLLTSPDQIAAAAPVLTSAAAANTGTGTIDAGTVTSPGSWVKGQYTLRFTAANAWQVVNAGNTVVASGAYTSGAAINFNGMQVHVGGTPATGDTFGIADNSNGSGDGRNARALADALGGKSLVNGTLSIADVAGGLIGDIGVKSAQAQAGRDAQQAVVTDANSALSNASGVNLDEEAANLLRYQQAYQAAARIISAAQEMFQTLLDATHR